VGLSELRREHDDLDAALSCLRHSRELGEHAGLPENRYRWYVAMARIAQVEEDPDRALDLLDEAQRRYIRSPDPDVRPVAAVRTRVLVGQGRLAEAREWAREQDLSVDDELSYQREFDHITLARVLMARHRRDKVANPLQEAMTLLGRLKGAAEDGGRMGSLIEILVLTALAYQLRGETSRALTPLARALTLAEPEGYVRTFVDEGPAMRTLLRHAAAAGITAAYTQRLLSAFDTSSRSVPAPANA
jgi:LuxR family transcriptional regulator, maltose regulon positive regulatory protein